MPRLTHSATRAGAPAAVTANLTAMLPPSALAPAQTVAPASTSASAPASTPAPAQTSAPTSAPTSTPTSATTAAPTSASASTLLDSREVLRGHSAVGISHNGLLYRLQTTRQGKLILTK